MEKSAFDNFRSSEPKKVIRKKSFQVNGEIAQEDAFRAMLYDIAPELECECDEFHTCQSCYERYKLPDQ